MNKPSRLFSFFIVVQLCAVVFVIGLGIVDRPPDRFPIRSSISDIRGGIKTALDRFAVDCGRFPTTAEGLQALVTCPTNISHKFWSGPYLDDIPKDPWGRAYIYSCPGVQNTNAYDLSFLSPPPPISSHTPPVRDIAPFLLIISLACAVCSVTANFSPKTREFLDRNYTAQFVWILISLIAFMLFVASLVAPQIHG